ncbi:MAG: hypothetical protein JWM25_1552 [Thermoleophilia bacterium]|nr:hypothetical protein [Thermoleophilia bacterium]MCZ4496967.1 hypothetical protein [Thermoleophilia bacterium]
MIDPMAAVESTFHVATLEAELRAALAPLAEGDEIGSVGLPLPGLEPLRVDGPGDAATVWWYAAPIGGARAATDETHRLALLHPRYDGFISLQVTARTDLSDFSIVADSTLAPLLTSHHLTGSLRRGQSRAVDLELHPGAIPAGGADGLLRIVDATGTAIAPPVRVTLATDPALECTLAGAVDGPWPADAFAPIIDELLAGVGGPRRLARRIAAVERGHDDPGWSRMPWGRSR